MEVMGFPYGSGIRLLGRKYQKFDDTKLDTLAPPTAILNPPLQEDAIAVRRLVIRRGIELGARFILSDSFGARHIDDEMAYNRVVDGQVAIVRSTLEELKEEGILPGDPEVFNGGAWFGPYGDCYRFKPEKNHFNQMLKLHLRQAEAAHRNNVEPQFEAVSSVQQAHAIAVACKEKGIDSPFINFVVSLEGRLAADGASLREAIGIVRSILPQAKIGMNCCRVIGAHNADIDRGPNGSFYPNASQAQDAWELEDSDNSHSHIDAALAEKIVGFAKDNSFERVGICCGADEQSLNFIIEANRRRTEKVYKKSLI